MPVEFRMKVDISGSGRVLGQWNGGNGMPISWDERRVGVRKRRP